MKLFLMCKQSGALARDSEIREFLSGLGNSLSPQISHWSGTRPKYGSRFLPGAYIHVYFKSSCCASLGFDIYIYMSHLIAEF